MPSQSVEHQDHCSQCNQVAPLLACDDEVDSPRDKNGAKPRFCNNCMIGKKVRVFWPVDESWYTGTVQQYDPIKGEHCLRYPDGDTEWVKIGEIIAASNELQLQQSQMNNKPSSDPSIRRSDAAAPSNPSAPGDLGSLPRSPDDRNATAGNVSGNLGGPPPPPMYGYGSAYPPPPAYHHGPPPHLHHPYGIPPGAYPPPPPGSYHGYPGGPPPPYATSSAPTSMGYGDSSAHHHHARDGGASASMSGKTSPDQRRKSGPKPWTKEEDALLMNLVHTMQWPMKWTVVAQSLPDRTGKQCRERYVNHLNPRLKNTDWTAVEDATIFHLYNTIGSHWAKMSKVIPGRTDNGIKNRFHNIRRQYEREDTHRIRLNAAHEHPEHVRLERLRKFPEHLTGKSTELWEMKQAVGVLAAQSVAGPAKGSSPGRFGPFRKVEFPDAADDQDDSNDYENDDDDPNNTCVRCGFMVPSVQTGSEICTKTGWCLACTRIPPNISGNLLRECLNLRRWPHNDDIRAVVESWEEFFAPTDPAEMWPYQKKPTGNPAGAEDDGENKDDNLNDVDVRENDEISSTAVKVEPE